MKIRLHRHRWLAVTNYQAWWTRQHHGYRTVRCSKCGEERYR